MKHVVSTLERILFEDGIILPGGGVERAIPCFNPHHEDKSPSMSVNVAQGVYFCHGCGISGNAYHYLLDFRGVDKNEAVQMLKESYDWKEDRIQKSMEQAREKTQRKSGLPKHTEHPYETLQGGAKAIAAHDYKLADGTLVCRVMRYEKKINPNTQQRTPKTLPFTPAKRGGWWVTGPLNDSIPDEDRRIKQYPLYRLPDMLAMASDSTRQVWIVEGEKCVDAVLSAADIPKGKPPPPCTSLMGAKTNMAKVDLSPLAGRPVVLIADTDKTSRDFMQRLGHHLHDEHGCAVKYVLPPGEGGYDIADALAEGGWAGFLAWHKKIGTKTHKKIRSEFKQTTAPIMPMSDTDYFKVLGIAEGDSVLILNKTTQEIHRIKRTAVFNEGNMLMIAPLTWWYDQCKEGGFTSTRRREFGDAIMRAAEAKGFMDIARIELGRGAHKFDGQYYFNLGGKLLMQDENNLMTVEKPLSDAPEGVIFRPGTTIKLGFDKHAQTYARAIYEAIMRYRWSNYTDGRAFVGWLVTSIIGGALPFRPMLWLLGLSGKGKTYLLENVLGRFFGPLVSELADATEAGMIGMMTSDSLPCIIDEFEPQKSKVESWQNILSLIRVSSGGKMGRLKGTAEGGFRYSRPRFSVILASVDKARMTDADMQRFYQLKLSTEGVKDWPGVKSAIEKSLRDDRPLAVRSHIIRGIPEIVEKTYEIEAALTEEDTGLDTRQAQMIASLTAGVGFLSGDYTPILGDKIVRRQADVEIIEQSIELLLELLGQVVMASEKNRRLTLAECLQYKLDKTASRYGFKMETNDHGIRELWCALSLNSMSGLLKNTKHANTDLNNYFKSLPGAYLPTTKSGVNKRAYFGGTQRSIVVLPIAILEAVGLDKPPEDEFALEGGGGDYYDR